jgi:hypothetical protein
VLPDHGDRWDRYPASIAAELDALEQLEGARDRIDRALVGDDDLFAVARWVESRMLNARLALACGGIGGGA